MYEVSRISSAPFNGALAWASLDAETQARIGATALEKAVAQAIFESDYPNPAGRAAEAALELADQELQEAALGVGGLHDRRWIDPVDGGETFRIPSVIGQVCHNCGCSEHDACEGGCGWASDRLCTACGEEAILA